MGIAIIFRKTPPRDIVKWEIVIRTEKWFLVFRRWGILLWCLSPLVFYYFNWRNPYTGNLRFTVGTLSPSKKEYRGKND